MAKGINAVAGALMRGQNNEWHLALFHKSLYVFLLLKAFYLWPLFGDLLAYKPFAYHSWASYVLFAPLVLTKVHVSLFLALFVVLLATGMALRPNYVTAFLICWFSISLSRLSLPVINGSDLVLNLLLIIAMALPARPRFPSPVGGPIQTAISNMALLFGQVQLTLIYLLSGYDKLMAASWRSGAAIDSINHLVFFHNPLVTVSLNGTACFLLGWSVILFELAFPFLVWFQRFRRKLLVVGLAFHAVIAVVLGLADFALVMVIGYGLYLPFKKSPPFDFSGPPATACGS